MKLIDTPCENNINSIIEKHFSSLNRLFGNVVNDKVASISFQTVKIIEIIKEVNLTGVS